IYLAAIGPKNVALAAEIADGWIPVFFSPRRMAMYREWLDAGFRAAGGRAAKAGFDIMPSTSVVVGDDVNACRTRVKSNVARVVVADVNETAAKAIVEKIERQGGQGLALHVDVARAADNKALVERAVATFGRLDVFYANAGVPQWKSDIEEVEEQVFDRIFD